MDEYGITIIDPNYRDIAAQQAYEREEQERTAEKLVIAAAREERMLNEPFFYEKVIQISLVILLHLKVVQSM